MKFIKYLLGAAFLLVLATACKKEVYDDVSFLDTAALPAKLGLMFDITQDNTGRVTITPNGEGAGYYNVYFGDATATPAKVLPGNNIVHAYREGLYSVKVVAFNVNGKSVELTKQLTVTFRAPENLEVTSAIDPSNNLTLNVSAKALYETNFRVFFGDVANEVPRSFLEGETVTHVYPSAGTYTMKVVAVSGGAATTELTRVITIVDPLLLPLTFESPTLAYNFSNFDGGNTTVINNPHANGINTSAKVAKMVKSAGQPWGGSVISLSSPIDFSVNKIFKMKVYSPRVGAKVLLKVENATNAAINFEKEVTTTVANAWEELEFDYSAINTANAYHNIVLIFDNGIMGDGSANFTFLLDDIRLTPPVLGIPLTFESSTLNYDFFNFDGGNTTIINNPQIGGINTSAKVAKMVKSAGQPWGGSVITLTNSINFSTLKTFKMKVFSPRVGAKVLLKVENLTNGGINYEKEVSTTVANAWEELTFDYSAINTANSYQKITLIFELGTMGDGSANFTFLFDDILLTN